MSKSPQMSTFLNEMAYKLFGRTIVEAHEKHICVCCGFAIRQENGADASGERGQIYSDGGEREYTNSGLCETCYDETMNSTEEN